MNADDTVVLVPYAEDPLALLAERLLEHHRPALPDLSAVVVLVPHAGVAGRARKLLTAAAHRQQVAAIVPPFIGTLDTWLNQYNHAADVGVGTRELLLMAALHTHAQLNADTLRWPFIDNLLTLFADLDANAVVLDDSDDLVATLSAGYGIAHANFRPLLDETRHAQTLWHAWRAHLREHALETPLQARAQALRHALQALSPAAHLYFVGPLNFDSGAREFVVALRVRRQATVILHGDIDAEGYHPATALSTFHKTLNADQIKDRAHAAPAVPTALAQWLSAVYTPGDTPMKLRARAFAQSLPHSPAQNCIEVFAANDSEDEARAVELQVRRRWLEGDRNIGVVTDDRKLARRVRALLERANIFLEDAAGWPLSTSAAATVISRWLDGVETDFALAPLLDVVTSPFALGEIPLVKRRQFAGRCAALQDRIAAHRPSAQEILRRIAADPQSHACATLSTQLQRARAVLLPLLQNRHTAKRFLDTLLESLEILGTVSAHARDAAGVRIQAELQDMHGAAARLRVAMNWSEFRAWLTHNLERRNFQPPMHGHGIEIMGLTQSRLYRFDTVIIAGAIAEKLPGPPTHGPFFNDAVRAQLGVRTARDDHLERYYDFRRLLEAAPHVLITYRHSDNGTLTTVSPWVERLQTFHLWSYGDDLSAQALAQLVASPQAELALRDAPLPPSVIAPQVSLPVALIPSDITPSAYQRLIDCPYQYFAMHALGLRGARETVPELAKADYGERVHRILQAFHSGAPGLPGPFTLSLDVQTLPQAQAMLEEISAQVFAADIARNFLARAWWYRWRRVIPHYLEWQQARTPSTHLDATEVELELMLGDLRLRGRIDRLDSGTAGLSVIDYKTGVTAKTEDIVAGEAVQLALYALLAQQRAPVAEALLLALDPEGVKAHGRIAGDELHALIDATRQRLEHAARDIAAGATLTAWGDDATCAYCDVVGLCRKPLWSA